MRLLERFEHQTAAAQFLDFRPTLFFGVPTIYVRLLETPPEAAREIGRDMRLFVSGSAPLARAGAGRVSHAFRPHHPRTLRHDRNDHEHLESVRGRAASRERGPAAARRLGARVVGNGRSPAERSQRVRRILEARRRHARRVRGRMVQDRRHRARAPPTATTRFPAARAT